MNEIPIFAKTYDLLLWLVPATLKYPREHRFALALRTQQAAFEFNELIVLARKTRDQRDLLLRADAHLEQLRLSLRLAHDLKLLTLRQYEHVSREVSAIGALLGDWMKRSGAQPPVERSRGAQFRPPGDGETRNGTVVLSAIGDVSVALCGHAERCRQALAVRGVAELHAKLLAHAPVGHAV